MKIKYNIQKIKELKNRYINVKDKILNNKENIAKINKANFKYYVLLFLMLVLGVISLTINIKKYNEVSKENYTTYTLEDLPSYTKTDGEKEEIKAIESIEENVQYTTAVSSISTNVSFEDELEKTTENENINVSKSTTTNKKYIYPVEGDILKDFARETVVYSKTLDMWKVHLGIDIAAKVESEVVSVCDGEVIEVSKSNFYGNTVKIQHKDGYVSVYSNLDEDISLKKGDEVKQGEVIGKIGVSALGEIADESHLHFEILKGTESINPKDVLDCE